uniref:Ral guanine nucleotide dissociation stimulator-like 1 n=1 Tax=Sinocyclocheilus grahami TaxID=75366 RepID=A0A672L3M0_SINGR
MISHYPLASLLSWPPIPHCLDLDGEEGVALQRYQPRSPESSPHCWSSVQDWGEEVEEGAIYNVTLKRVQIQQAANKGARWLGAEGDRLPPGHTVSQLETCKIRSIRAGTLERLVETLLTAFGDNDLTYTSIFLSTYRAFATTQNVLELLLDRYGSFEDCEGEHNQCRTGESRVAVRTALASILRAWLDQCPEDFQEPPSYPSLHRVLGFLRKAMPGSEPMRRAQSLLEQLHVQASLENETQGGFQYTNPFCIGEDEEVEIDLQEDFFSFKVDLVAEQLTYMDALLFKKVVPHHCLGAIWSQRDKKDGKQSAPTIRATITQFNAVTACVVSTILRQRQIRPHLRARIIQRWIDVAQECRIRKNFSSLRAIVSALQSNPIYRLKRVWASVSNLDSCAKDHQKRSHKRLQLQKEMGAMQGTIPYLGTFLTDLTMLDTALPDQVEGGLLNFEKRRRVSTTFLIIWFLLYQDKTPAVISRAMAKHNLEGEQAADYELVQVISEERELVIPDNANVFYAMSTSANFDFLLRLRGSEGRPVQLRSRCSSTLPRTQQRSSLSLRLSKVTL